MKPRVSQVSVRSEAEYISSNNHRPFKDSQETINANRHKDGGIKCNPSYMAINGASSKDQCNKGKSKHKKPGDNKAKPVRRRMPDRARKGYQVHLKKEDGDFNESIEYNVEFPNRVSVRMEYLMTSTKVRLNDKKFMDELYDKLVKEERKTLEKSTKMRQAVERNRMKKLVIEGQMPPPDDMLELYDHPVFRVNAMLKRLDQHDKGLYTGPKIEGKITPVEPYEFNGDHYFKHLHQHGTDWIPSEEQMDEGNKLAGKIARAKLRLMEKRRMELEEAKMKRLLQEADQTIYDEDDDINDENDESLESKEEKRRLRISRLKERLIEEANKRAALFKKRRSILEGKERKRRDRSLSRQKERDKVFLEDQDGENLKIIAAHRLRMAGKTLSYFKGRLSDEGLSLRGSREAIVNYKTIFEQPKTPPKMNEDESFKQIRKAFHIKGGNKLSQYGPRGNPTVARYIDTVKNAKELFYFGNELSKLYSREQSRADEFMIKLNRML